MKIVLYTHSDVNWVWPFWLAQTDKYLSNYDKIAFVNDNSFERKDYTTIQYDDSLIYRQRVSSCLDQLDPQEVIVFHHEDMFLYDEPNLKILDSYEKVVADGQVDLIKLLRNGTYLKPYDKEQHLYSNPPEYGFAIQPTMCKVETLNRIFKEVKGNTIWDFETNAQKEVSKWDLTNLFIYNGCKKRGLAHWDSTVYPYVATAVVKGQWNFSEYRDELKRIGVHE